MNNATRTHSKDPEAMSSHPPLEQRTSSRRAHRRDTESKRESNDEGEQQQQRHADSNTSHGEVTCPRRGPSSNLERLIQEAIEKRKLFSEGLDEAVYEETDIIGTYEYLDHTADVQLHSWGATLEEALEQLAIALFGYMTQLSRISVQKDQSERCARNVQAQGHDLQSLVFAFLQEWLYVFHDTGFVAREVRVNTLDRDRFMVASSGMGELVDWSRHLQGTEIKAISYSNLQVLETQNQCDIWVIVDI